ncbi:IclR family transcriptional regulator [Limibaculum sp. FT325]|uniref:IclR family transcriptional regulator n=1 Tax=Thermohalobaculum sediminis TaxID=2939436 RepID=UPI0020C15100|nr:IclR family transcriptional regulator [Limibaculum sediminis]MCL5775930.1 IclR family transcriptional regulator [Limibaculum sediminis]
MTRTDTTRTPETEGEDGKDRQFVTALARGLSILRAFRPGEVALGNQELAERTGLPKPTVSRLTNTLRELGYLVDHGRMGSYSLGPGVLALGYAMLAGLEIRERARPMLQALANEAACSVALGARDRLSVVYLDCYRGPATVTLSLEAGSRIPLATTAMGRAILAVLPAGERDYLMRAARERMPDEFPAIEKGVARAIREIETQGFCTSFGDWMADVNAVGVPVVAPDGQRIYGLNCGGPSFSTPVEALIGRHGPRLVEIGRELSTPGATVARG